mmetsp:Transcript_1504/g.5313  ORF Transcript_1504/g.5313 Transcript_1504/m.5313 type:complete len:265 (-) Transcript_1504:1035-1829(-)
MGAGLLSEGGVSSHGLVPVVDDVAAEEVCARLGVLLEVHEAEALELVLEHGALPHLLADLVAVLVGGVRKGGLLLVVVLVLLLVLRHRAHCLGRLVPADAVVHQTLEFLQRPRPALRHQHVVVMLRAEEQHAADRAVLRRVVDLLAVQRHRHVADPVHDHGQRASRVRPQLLELLLLPLLLGELALGVLLEVLVEALLHLLADELVHLGGVLERLCAVDADHVAEGGAGLLRLVEACHHAEALLLLLLGPADAADALLLLLREV